MKNFRKPTPKPARLYGQLITDMRPTKNVATKKKLKVILKNKMRLIGIVALVVLAILITWLLSRKPSTLGSAELKSAKTSIGMHIILPTDEEPTLAVVDDTKVLKDPFLKAKAETNDQILIYTQNQMVIVYRPSINKIVAVGNITADSAMAEAEGASATVLNGANDKEKTQRILALIKSLYPNLKITDGGNSNKTDFPNTIIIDNTNNKDELVEALVKGLPAKRGVLPLSETKGNSDLLIIVGKD